jgi:hypothetical protein
VSATPQVKAFVQTFETNFSDSATPELLQLLKMSFALCDFWAKYRA